jgi:hypothetical protein
MTVGIIQIDRDLAELKTAVVSLCRDTQSQYEQYLRILGRAVRQQLILASYHVCTQVYPQQFLNLSTSQQQQLQHDLQTLGKQTEAAVLESLTLIEHPELSTLDCLTELMQSYEKLEAAIAESLHQASRDVNHLLQSAEILPVTPLEIVLDIAAKAEAAGRSVTRNPNLLTAMVDSSAPEDGKEAAVIAVYLQLGEIEFNDPAVTLQRNQIRKLHLQMVKFKQEIAKKQQERLVVEAGSAWRSLWQDQL